MLLASLHEAKTKSCKATFTSDLSTNENKETRKNWYRKIVNSDDVHVNKKSKLQSSQILQQQISSPPKFIVTGKKKYNKKYKHG